MGLARAKKEGKRLGRPIAATRDDVRKLKAAGLSQSAAAAKLSISLSTVKRLWRENEPLTTKF